MSATPLLVRADASSGIGTGHVMRCLALAQAWRRTGGQVHFLHAAVTPALDERIRSEGFETGAITLAAGSVEDARTTVARARALGCSWIVADGYAFGAVWQREIKAAGLRLLLLDDYGHAEHYHADVVLNQNASADATLYARRDPATRLLLGPRYALLREEFVARAAAPDAGGARGAPVRVLVTLGGSDPENVTGLVIAALGRLSGIEATVVVGGSNPNLAAVQAAVAAAPVPVRLVVNSHHMPELMAGADVAISAAGSTVWELAFMGLPAALIVTADNQAAIADAVARAGAGLHLGRHTALSAVGLAQVLGPWLDGTAARIEMSGRARQLVDGRGARRVCAALAPGLAITLLTDAESWINPHLAGLKTGFEQAGHRVRWIHDPLQIEEGDVAFFLSLGRIVPEALLRRHAHNLVVHESALPRGRGWSPLTWQILEGQNEIPVSLIEAAAGVDTGDIHARETLRFSGHECVAELRAAQAAATCSLCRGFIADYPFNAASSRPQTGTPGHYPRRRPADSRLDPDKTLRDQFNLLRVCDPERYPAFMEIDGRRYEVRVTPVSPSPL